MLREEQSQTSKISMSATRVGMGAGPFILCANIVDHVPQVVIGWVIIGMQIVDIVFWELQNDGYECVNFTRDFFVQLAMETGNIFVVLFDNLVSAFVGVLGDCFGYVELYYVNS
jgi:hypothetical protein